MLDKDVFEFYPKEKGTRIKDIKAKVEKITGFSGIYGYTYIYSFVTNNFHFVWITSSRQMLKKGDLVILTGTIKKFDIYKGIHITYLTRCKITIKQ